jgi:hypothetical protein
MAIRACFEIFQANRICIYPDQYNNPANWLAHYDSTVRNYRTNRRAHHSPLWRALGTMGLRRRHPAFSPDMPQIKCYSGSRPAGSTA